MLNLTIQHIIYLTRDQRYLLHEGEPQEVIGVSVPVWFMGKVTSEPAKEVFCKYYLKNTKEETPVKILQDGYEIDLPNREGQQLTISDEEWLDLSMNNPEKLRLMYDSLKKEASSKNLLDIKDGGSSSLFYREHNKVKKSNSTLNILHFIRISDIAVLTASF